MASIRLAQARLTAAGPAVVVALAATVAAAAPPPTVGAATQVRVRVSQARLTTATPAVVRISWARLTVLVDPPPQSATLLVPPVLASVALPGPDVVGQDGYPTTGPAAATVAAPIPVLLGGTAPTGTATVAALPGTVAAAFRPVTVTVTPVVVGPVPSRPGHRVPVLKAWTGRRAALVASKNRRGGVGYG